jgi:hypothetical protein
VPWKFRPLGPLEQDNNQLRTERIKLRRKLTNKEGYAAKLELALHQRLESIDALRGRIEQLQERNRRLDEENEHLVETFRGS